MFKDEFVYEKTLSEILLFPKSSEPLSIMPLLFLSIARSASSPLTQPVASLKPLLSKSKFIGVSLCHHYPSQSQSEKLQVQGQGRYLDRRL